MKRRHGFRWVLLASAVLVGSAAGVVLEGDAQAIIGRPLTPFSYAGVARRTTRRAAYVGAVAGPYPVAAPYPVTQPYYW